MTRQTEVAAESQLMSRTRDCLDGHVLTYSQRQKLLEQATSLGIGRFRANLLIAMAQHGETRGVAADAAGTKQGNRFFGSIFTDLFAAMLIQGVLVLAVYLLWFR